jgi:hypothetical protein
MDAVRRKRPEKLRTDIWFHIHDNAPEHRSVFVKNFIAKNNVTTPEHSPYSLDLAADDFYLLSRPKPPLKGQYFCDASGIIKNATEKLNRLL